MLGSIPKELSFNNDYNAATNTPNLNTSLINHNLTGREVVKKTNGDYFLTSKKQIQLPKTKLTKHGQILLYTTQENEQDLKRLRANNLFYYGPKNQQLLSPVSNSSSTHSAQNLMKKMKIQQKNYSKKWINNVSDDFYFDLSDIVLNEKVF
jgi:hypothetical protein